MYFEKMKRYCDIHLLKHGSIFEQSVPNTGRRISQGSVAYEQQKNRLHSGLILMLYPPFNSNVFASTSYLLAQWMSLSVTVGLFQD